MSLYIYIYIYTHGILSDYDDDDDDDDDDDGDDDDDAGGDDVGYTCHRHIMWHMGDASPNRETVDKPMMRKAPSVDAL